MRFTVDLEKETIEVDGPRGPRLVPFGDPEAFELVSDAWLRLGWDAKYVYGFTWLGRPVIQLPEDLVRLQELVHAVQPDVIVETGVAHGGSLVFYASLCAALDRGRVVGVDVEIRPHNREALDAHPLRRLITLIEGDSTASATVAAVREAVGEAGSVMVVLDSGHSRDHVRAELEAYSALVSVGSYLLVADGIMETLVGAPRSGPDWGWNNPRAAVEGFLAAHEEFVLEPPAFPFNEGTVRRQLTYWPGGRLRRLR